MLKLAHDGSAPATTVNLFAQGVTLQANCPTQDRRRSGATITVEQHSSDKVWRLNPDQHQPLSFIRVSYILDTMMSSTGRQDMTRKEYGQARTLVEEMLRCTRKGSAAHLRACELKVLLKPGPTIGDIILGLPAENHKERAKAIGISRQGYYNLIQGTARPNAITRKRLADMTGLAEEVIQEASP